MYDKMEKRQFRQMPALALPYFRLILQPFLRLCMDAGSSHLWRINTLKYFKVRVQTERVSGTHGIREEIKRFDRACYGFVRMFGWL